ITRGEYRRIRNINDIGTQYYQDKDYSNALEQFKNAYEINSKDSVLKFNLINAYVGLSIQEKNKGNLNKAEKLLKKALELNDTVPNAHIILAAVYLDKGDYVRAKGELEIAKVFDPSNVSILIMLGEIYFQQGDMKNALTCWTRSKEKDPYNVALERKIKIARKEWNYLKSFETKSLHPFVVMYDKKDKHLADKVLSFLVQAYINIGKQFQYYPLSEITVILYNPDQFAQVTGSKGFVAGLYDGKIRIKNTKHLLNDKFLRKILYHEYTHVVLRFLTNDECPFWLNEGMAQSFSGPVSRIDLAMLSNLDLESHIFQLKNLETFQGLRQVPDHYIKLGKTIEIAYIKSLLTTNFMINTYGMDKCLKVFKALARKKSIAESIQTVLGISIDELDRRVLEKISDAKERLVELIVIEEDENESLNDPDDENAVKENEGNIKSEKTFIELDQDVADEKNRTFKELDNFKAFTTK
ncbi:hypothetical protein J7L67_01300, partial [bacterium]|nr:hypothetical protein [bacterium]